ncbi:MULTISPECIES: hypothetical protein [unclassified Bradyrhizobium]|nr:MULTISPECIES: hypothetical protein [unclassified Bradyrhizobium]
MINHLPQPKISTAAQREAQKAFKTADARVALSEHERAKQAS